MKKRSTLSYHDPATGDVRPNDVAIWTKKDRVQQAQCRDTNDREDGGHRLSSPEGAPQLGIEPRQDAQERGHSERGERDQEDPGRFRAPTVDLTAKIPVHGNPGRQIVPIDRQRDKGRGEQDNFQPTEFCFHFRFPFFIRSRIQPNESSSTVVSRE